MRRHRTIGSSPKRTAGETWGAICSLIGDTLERSNSFDRGEIDGELRALDQVARMLISGGHLEHDPLVLAAGDFWLEIATVSGDDAITLQENLNPVPGAANATIWTLFVPESQPMAKLVRIAVKGHTNLSTGEPSGQVDEVVKESAGIDLEALAVWAGEGR